MKKLAPDELDQKFNSLITLASNISTKNDAQDEEIEKLKKKNEEQDKKNEEQDKKIEELESNHWKPIGNRLIQRSWRVTSCKIIKVKFYRGI